MILKYFQDYVDVISALILLSFMGGRGESL